ncbi:MAG: hypothetical protein ACLSE6_05970 [Alphaproteobacteria bacterium]
MPDYGEIDREAAVMWRYMYEDHTTRAEYVYVVDNRAIGVV